ncbi:MAG TPA: 3-deoxy-7-phosphoheptulonate synthase [Gemmatimonadaceae bacterium]|nr:3-deoxy-7-phosphoheptulonate synthase [Gemmatimonadaceae bacterium]
MLVMMQRNATPQEIEAVCEAIQLLGFNPLPMPGALRTAIGVAGDDGQVDTSHFEGMAGVAQVLYDSKPYKQVSREWQPEKSLVSIGNGVVFGGTEVPVVAGPCSVEGEKEILHIAHLVKAAGAVALRGGAYKPRTSPYAFQGLGEEGLRQLALARSETGLPIITEAMDEHQADLVAKYADCIQLGARNMSNFSLLKHVGKLGVPVLLKRGMSATITEWLLAAEYIMSEGNRKIILCERGIRSFDTATRNVFDLAAIPVVQKLSHLPIIADPSHGVGIRDAVPPLSRASVACGADGVIVEVHQQPDKAWSDGAQSLHPPQFDEMVRSLVPIAEAVGRSIMGAGTAVA